MLRCSSGSSTGRSASMTSASVTAMVMPSDVGDGVAVARRHGGAGTPDFSYGGR